MATRGTESKNVIFAKLQEVFPNTFWEDQGKILRVPLDENGSRVEIKVVLTAAKNNLKEDNATSAFDNTAPTNFSINADSKKIESFLEPTQEEKENVNKLLAALNL